MVKIPEVHIRAIKTITKDIAEWKEIYKREYDAFLNNRPEEDYHDTEYFIDFQASLDAAEESFKGYLKYVLQKLHKFRFGQLVSVRDMDGNNICRTTFRQAYLSIKEGYVYFSTEASNKKQYDVKKCTVVACIN
jgi:hypothetical protein